ncbi:hypothetical protein DL96DRAFT_1168104 [Flagelloscypha sp. PMI_526]|nr:hypothetical protein DL96DRAFT_1168104 [Flagelloscypha sp. PMI_526]
MGDAGSSHSHKSGSASPNNVGAAHATYDVNMHHASPLSAPWPSPSDLVTATQANYPAMPGPYTNPNAPFEAYETGASYRQVSPDSMTPSHFPTTLFPETFTTGGRQMTGQVPSSSYATPYTPNSTSPSPQSLETENRLLRKRLRDMEALYRQSEEQLRSFTGGMQLAQASLHPSVSTSQHTSPPPSPTFQASWNARTEARIRLFCSLNRAGNALCAWHDSRRERRAYPPRNAPPGVLNCGCTYEEALFEESLARHNVGSYHPGESVRMDPALRNPLLRLLQDRYGYRDGDFERASQNGRWVGDEGPAIWEQKVHAGVRGKTRPERNPSAS